MPSQRLKQQEISTVIDNIFLNQSQKNILVDLVAMIILVILVILEDRT